MNTECQGDQAGPPSLENAIKHWHAAEMEISRLEEALTKVLRLQAGVSPHAKTIIREALAGPVTRPNHGKDSA